MYTVFTVIFFIFTVSPLYISYFFIYIYFFYNIYTLRFSPWSSIPYMVLSLSPFFSVLHTLWCITTSFSTCVKVSWSSHDGANTDFGLIAVTSPPVMMFDHICHFSQNAFLVKKLYGKNNFKSISQATMVPSYH